MTKPRFSVGDMVLVHSVQSEPERNGTVALVKARKYGRWRSSLGQRREGWTYFLTDQHPLPVGEPNLRPYDPPATWDDCVWQPEALKETEEA